MPFHQDYLGVEQPAVGQLIRELWQTLRLIQEKFTAQLGVSFPTINGWENGHTTPSHLALKQIDTLLDRLSESPDAVLCEQALRESEERYRTLFESIDQGFCLLEVLFDANDKAYDYPI